MFEVTFADSNVSVGIWKCMLEFGDNFQIDYTFDLQSFGKTS